MPVLPNPRHEKFAQSLAKGKTADEAYQEAGYKPNRGNAARMKANESISDRVEEIQSTATKRAAVTVEDIARQLDEDRQFARQCGSATAAVSATMGKAKVLGLVVEKQDLTSSDGTMSPKPAAFDLASMSDDEIAEYRTLAAAADRNRTGD